MNELLVALEAFWAERGIRPSAGASDVDILALEDRYGLHMPADLRAYFRAINGMSSGAESRRDMDDDLIRFYPLAECQLLNIAAPEIDVPDARSILCVADYSIWCWGYGVRLGTDDASPVHVIYDAETVKVADSWEAFLRAYIRRDYAVTYPR